MEKIKSVEFWQGLKAIIRIQETGVRIQKKDYRILTSHFSIPTREKVWKKIITG